MARRLEELTRNELIKVFESNEKLRNEVRDDYEEMEMYWVSEILDCFRGSLSDWTIGFCNRNYITIRDEYGFLEGLLKAQNDYGFLGDDYTPLIEKTLRTMQNVDDTTEIDEKTLADFATLEEQTISEFGIRTEFVRDETLLEHFLEFYIDERMRGDFYIDDAFTLYQTQEISYS